MTRKTIPLDAPAVQRGVGFFETLLVHRGRPVLVERHVERLRLAVEKSGFPSPEASVVLRRIRSAAARAADAPDCAVRCSWLAIAGDLDAFRSWLLDIRLLPISQGALSRREQGRVILLPPSLRRGDPEVKTISYMPAVTGLRRAQASGADEALFTDRRGHVLEGTATNVFCISGTELATPPVRRGILPGIVRGWVLENASRAGLNPVEKDLTPERLREGSFLTGSLTGIAAIRTVDGRRCRLPGPALRRLRMLYEREVLA